MSNTQNQVNFVAGEVKHSKHVLALARKDLIRVYTQEAIELYLRAWAFHKAWTNLAHCLSVGRGLNAFQALYADSAKALKFKHDDINLITDDYFQIIVNEVYCYVYKGFIDRIKNS